jgi:SecD/SecF fusion protein
MLSLLGKPTIIKDAKDKDVDAVELYALKGNRDNVAAMSGGVVTDASDSFDQSGKPAVSMQMNGQGAKAWEELTGRAYTQKRVISLFLTLYILLQECQVALFWW